MAEQVPRGAILRIALKIPQSTRERWCVVLTDPGRLDTSRFGVYITSVKIKLLGAHPQALSAILLEAMDAARKNLAKAESS